MGAPAGPAPPAAAGRAEERIEADEPTGPGSGRTQLREKSPGAATDAEKDGDAADSAAGDGQPSGLALVLSRLSRTSVTADPAPPPDGGLTAWTQVAMGHLIIFCTWGYINSFGVFQTYYVQTLGHPPSDISWVGSMQIWLLFGIGTFSGRATDAGYFRACLVAGVVLQLLGVFATSVATTYWQLFLAQGVCTGIGNGLLFCPTVALIPTYFERRRAFALAIVASGSATGGLVFPAIIEALLPRVGFGWSVRAVAFVMLALQTTAVAFTRTRLPPRRAGPVVEWAAFRETPFALFGLGVFLLFWGVYPAFYYIGEYAATVLRADQATSINLLLVMNGVGIPGRVIPGFVSDRYTGPMNLLIPCAAASGIALYCWIAVHDTAGLYAFAAVNGICAAMMQGIFPAALSRLTTDVKRMGTRMGMGFTIISFAVLTGSPIAGALIQNDGGSYLAAQLFVGTCLFAGTLALIGSRIASAGWKLKVKI